jgi:SAM-dependent methyltransferase
MVARERKLGPFDLAEGLQLGHAIRALHELGVLNLLRKPMTSSAAAKQLRLDPATLSMVLCYCAARTTVIASKRNNRFQTTGAHGPMSEFLIDMYAGAFGQHAIALESLLEGSRTGPQLINRTLQARAFRSALADEEPPIAGIIRQLQFNHVLDLGCGSGVLLRALATQSKDFHGTGIDFNPEMCRVARTTMREAGVARQVRIFRGDIREDMNILPNDLRATIKTLVASNVANEFFDDGRRTLLSWLVQLKRCFPNVIMLLADYYGRLGVSERVADRQTLLHDYVQSLSGQGVPFADLRSWKAIYRDSGCHLIHCIEDKTTTQFIHILRLGG